MKNAIIILLSLLFIYSSITAQQKNPPSISSIDDICGTDDRVPYSHDAVGRIWSGETPTTGWILFDGRIVTAWHVLEGDYSGRIEFNVPVTSDDCDPDYSHQNDEYVIDYNSIVHSPNSIVGDDWAIFSVFPNEHTGKMPIDAQDAFFYIEQTSSPGELRIIGFGEDSDTETRCHESQASNGSYEGLDGTTIKHKVDTESGSSGSPIINTSTGRVIGIHTNEGCGSSGYNSGTSMFNSSLWNATGVEKALTVRQNRQTGSSTNKDIYRWEIDEFVAKPVPAQIPVEVGSTEFLKANRDSILNPFEKYKKWSTNSSSLIQQEFFIDNYLDEITSEYYRSYGSVVLTNNFLDVTGINPSNDVIQFKDPWLIDDIDPTHANSEINRGMNASFKSRLAPFSPNYTTSYNNEFYKGIFLNQDFNIQNQPFYSIKVTTPQEIHLTKTDRTHKFYFQNWTFSNATLEYPNELETAIIFNAENTEVKGNFKGASLSDNATFLNNTPQRKLISAHSGEIHVIYESMDKIWLEWSMDDGATWLLRNDGKPISEGVAKNPSIVQNGQSEYIITYQERRADGTSYNIVAVLFDGIIQEREIVKEQPNKLYTEDANPIAICSRSGISDFVVIWNEADYGGFLPGGLYYRRGAKEVEQTGNELSFASSDSKIIGTTEDSQNPTAACKIEQATYPIKFHVAWDQEVSSSSSKINYTQFTLTSSGISYISTEEASSGSGYTKNYSPSLVVMDDNLPRLTWVGEKSTPSIEKKVVLRGRSASSWNSTFFKYGNNVNAVSMNFNETGTIGGYAFAWSEGSPTITGHKSVVNTRLTWNPVNISGAEGKYIHLSNGDDIEDMYAIGLDNEILPYELVLSDHITQDAQSGGEGELKVAANVINSIGREGLINYNGNVFSFELFDIILDNEVIEFESLNDMTTFNDIESLNGYLESLPFEIADNSSLKYSVKYGIQEALNQELVLSENEFVNYKVQLIDESTNEVIGSYDNITFTHENLAQYNNIDYNILTEGIGARTVKMRLVVSSNIDADPNLSAIYCDGSMLAKNGATNINYDGAVEIKTYDLAQNYPNPFNPSTTIKYQIPSDGNVSLKIYDVLGAEVMTLLNTLQSKGRYEVNFDASQLASGVYIYRIQANDYTASRKMMLLK